MKNEMQTAADAAAEMAKPMVEQTAQEIAPASTDSQADALLAAVQSAVAAGKDADTIERLLAMSERIMDRKATEVFWSDFHQARADMPAIKARGTNQTTKSNYALLQDVQKLIVPVYSKYGFNMVFSTDQSPIENHVRIVADVTHRSGHCEQYHTDLPLDMTGMKGQQNKTAVHATGSTTSYGQRYLTCLVWNVEVQKNPLDDDGNAGGAVELLTDEQAANISALWDEVGGDLQKFLQPYGCEDFAHMPQKFLKRAIHRLEQKRAQG